MNDSHGSGWHHGMHHMRRANLLNPKEIIDFLEIKEGEKVIDLGGGDGFFTKEILERTRDVTIIDAYDGSFNELQSLGIKTIKGDICKYDSDQYDLVYISNVYHDLIHSCKESIQKNIPKIAKKRVAILDFKPEVTTFGPPSWLKISKEDVIRDFEIMSFHLTKEKDLKTHYLLMFEK